MNQNLPGFKELFRSTWQVYKQNWKKYTKVYLAGYALMLVVLIATLIVFFVGYLLLRSFGIGAFSMLAALIVLPGFIYTQSWLKIALAQAIWKTHTENENSSIRQFFKDTKPLVLPYALLIILQSAIAVSGYFALIIPGIFFSLWFSLSTFTFLIDGKRNVSALILSREYIRGYTGVVFIMFLGFWLITGVLFSWLPGFILSQLDLRGMNIIWNIISAIVLSPLQIIFSYKIYLALKEIKGQMDGVDYSAARRRKYIIVALIPAILLIPILLIILNPIVQVLPAYNF